MSIYTINARFYAFYTYTNSIERNTNPTTAHQYHEEKREQEDEF